MFKRYRFNRICKQIKDLKIQGATNVAKAALEAYYLYPNKITQRILRNLRPTEPLLFHVLDLAEHKSKQEILAHFKTAQEKINLQVFKLINDGDKIFTHCHSTNVIRALIYAKNHGKHFEVYNTETRPLYQGRLTARELSRAGIKVTNFVDSAAAIAIARENKQDKEYVNKVFLGADAILEDAVINKVGSGIIAEIAKVHKIPVYIIADSWKYAKKELKIEQRDFKEVWNPRYNKIHIRNPAFESINPKNITLVISELGILGFKEFLKKAKKL